MTTTRTLVILFLAAILTTTVACKKEGCTDETATNYNAEADTDDGSCVYPPEEPEVLGCTDSTATNYNPDATEDDGTCEYAPEGNPCEGESEFCMDYDGINKHGDADVTDFGNGTWRIYWSTGTGGDYEQVELDIHGSDVGTYAIDTTGAAGTASVQYFHATDGVDNCVSGTVEISTWDPTGDGITGTFEGTTEKSLDITDGNFYEAKD